MFYSMPPYIIYNWEHLENGFDWIPYFIYLFSCFSFRCLGFNITKSQHSFRVQHFEVVPLIRKQSIQHFGQGSTSWVVHTLLRTKINIWKINRAIMMFYKVMNSADCTMFTHIYLPEKYLFCYFFIVNIFIQFLSWLLFLYFQYICVKIIDS